MRRVLSTLLIVAGSFMIVFFLYEFFSHSISAKKSLKEAEQIVANRTDLGGEQDKQAPFLPDEDEIIGVLSIPKIDKKLSIIEGTDEDMLEKGVGHYSSTVFPGENEQILLSGHRDTAFRHFDELEIGDRFIVEMPYGTFEYEMRETEIVDALNTSVIRPMGEEVLTLSTCYPFGYIGPAPNRYIIYAYPL